MRLPRRVVLPFGYVVQVKPVTAAEMRIEQDAGADDEPHDGLWDHETRTIFVRRGLSLSRQRYILGHEMCHALADWIHECLNTEEMKP